MPNWPRWTKDEELVLVYFLSCGIRKRGVRKLISYKCNTPLRNEQDMKHHVFELHRNSRNDGYNGYGSLLSSRTQAPTSRGECAEVWAIDWKDSWKERNVDDFLTGHVFRRQDLGYLIDIGREEEELICDVSFSHVLLLLHVTDDSFQEQEADEIDWDWVGHRQELLVEKHRRRYYGDDA